MFHFYTILSQIWISSAQFVEKYNLIRDKNSSKLSEIQKNHWTIHFKWMNSMICELSLNWKIKHISSHCWLLKKWFCVDKGNSYIRTHKMEAAPVTSPHHKSKLKSACTYGKHLPRNPNIHQSQFSNLALTSFPYLRKLNLPAL